MAQPGSEAEQVEGQDEEFVFRLARGSELLAAGDAEGARGALARALELRPRDAKVLGLLGQASYRLGRYDDAIAAWQRLVDESPAEPAARVNLGLAFLRARRQSQATRQLEIALDLNPDHKKAMGYLGLALLESGDPLRAREWFKKAGSDQMVARCDQALAAVATRASQAEQPEQAQESGDASPPAPKEPTPTLAAAAAPLPVEVELGDIADLGPPAEGWAPAEHGSPLAMAVDLPIPPTTTLPLGIPSGARASELEPDSEVARDALPDLAAFASSRLVLVPEGPTFAISSGILSVQVRSAVRVRMRGLLAARGPLAAAPEVKRFHGRPTEKPFGHGPSRLHRVEGHGTLLYAVGETIFTALSLGAEAFFREEVLFGLEDPIAFENGRVPSPGAGELDLVHLRGQGAVLLATVRAPRALDVSPEAPLRLPVAALVGWLGAITPRFTALFAGGPPEALAVELTGEGRVLVDPGPAAREAQL